MAADVPARAGHWRAPLWSSGFRPFFLLGLCYGLVAIAAWFGAYAGPWGFVPTGGALSSWHGHEMVFGFLVAIICGLLLTALPSWAGVPEISGGALALLAGAWLAGRFAVWLSPVLPWPVVAAADVSVLLLLAAMLAPGLLAARERKFLVVLPVILALAGANLAFHSARATAAGDGMSHALDTAVATIVVLYALVGGFMTPVFTDNALSEQRSPLRVWRHPVLELAALACAVAFALAEAFRFPPRVTAVVALSAAVVHAIRLAGWRGWRVRRAPLVLAMHAGYAWLVVAFVLRAVSELGLDDPPRAWTHAVTVGAVGMMILALLPRIALRHTGRALRAPPVIVGAGVAMFVAAMLRLAAANGAIGAAAAAAALWAAALAVCLVLYGPMFARPSMPRRPASNG